MLWLWFAGKEKERKFTGDIIELCRELTGVKPIVGEGAGERKDKIERERERKV